MAEDQRFNFLSVRRRIQDNKPFLVLAGKVKITLPDFMMKGQGLFLEAVLAFHVPPSGSPEPHLYRAIQQEREMRPDPVRDNPIQKPDERSVLSPGSPLVNHGGIGKAITNHPLSSPESRLNDLLYVLSPVRSIEHEFC